jgi:anthranilate synthase component 2
MKIVIIDNYDSFTYNLSHLIKELGAEVTVLRNDQFSLDEIEAYNKIVLSPGPGIPSEAGLLLDVIRTYAGRKPILGVCLGHQAIGEAFGGKLENLSDVFHGVATPCHIIGEGVTDPTPAPPLEGRGVSVGYVGAATPLPSRGGVGGGVSFIPKDPMFSGLEKDITVGRYHSWVVSREGFPDCLEITAVSDEGQIMALRHRELNVRGIQFHPESVLTPDGKKMIQNFLFQ